jgi:hypothetical protein
MKKQIITRLAPHLGFGSGRFVLPLILALGGLTAAPAAENPPQAVPSYYAKATPQIDGVITWGEWKSAPRIPFGHGYVSFMNDPIRLYVLVNVLDEQVDDNEDSLSLSFDLNGDGALADGDLNYLVAPTSRDLTLRRHTGPSTFEVLKQRTFSSRACAFGSALADASKAMIEPGTITESKHRVWEMAIDLEEIQAEPGATLHLGLRVSSPAAGMDASLPADFDKSGGKLLGVATIAKTFPYPFGHASVSLDSQPMEVTQAIQTRDNDLPLVEDKKTVVRIYPVVSGTSPFFLATVRLYGRRDGVELSGSPLSQFKIISGPADREDLSTTPYFVLPDDWISGTVELEATVSPLLSTGTSSDSATETVTFQPKESPNIWVVPLNTGTEASPVLVSDSIITSQESYLETAYPVASVNFVDCDWEDVGTTTESDAIDDLNDYATEVFWTWFLSLLFTGSAPYDLPDQIYGFAPSGGGLSDPVWAGGNGLVARGYLGTSLEGTMAHEINHNLDRDSTGTWGRHVDGCGTTGVDSAWPYSNDDIQEVGFDTRDPISSSSVVPSDFPDFMSYCTSGTLPTKWISPYRWENLFDTVASDAADASDSGSGGGGAADGAAAALILPNIQPMFYISGELRRDGTGTLRPVLRQPGLPTHPRPGQYAIELRDAQGMLLSQTSFHAQFEDVEGGLLERTRFHLRVRALPQTAEIRLTHGQTILSRQLLSAHAPQVTLLRPNGGETWNGKGLIEWSASDADGDTLFFHILYSPDDGRTWRPVARLVQGRSFPVNTFRLPGSDSARIRIIATDGLRNAEDDSDETFSVAYKVPAPIIKFPRPGVAFPYGSRIPLRASAGDLERVQLPDDDYIWSLDGEVIALGHDTKAILPPGEHLLELTVVNGHQQMATRTVAVTVNDAASNSKLQIAMESANVLRISWPKELGPVLQSAARVTGPYADLDQVATEEDGQYVLRLAPEAKSRFFRLPLE